MNSIIRRDYPFRVWRLVLPIGFILWLSLLFALGIKWQFSLSGNVVLGVVIFASIGLLIIAPTILIYDFSFRYLASRGVSLNRLRFTLSLIGMGAICLTFFILFGIDAFDFVESKFESICTASFAASIPIATYCVKLV